VSDLETDAAGRARRLLEHEQAATEHEKLASSLQAELASKAEALLAAQARITELDQERADTATRAATCEHELVATKACHSVMPGAGSASTLTLCMLLSISVPCRAECARQMCT